MLRLENISSLHDIGPRVERLVENYDLVETYNGNTAKGLFVPPATGARRCEVLSLMGSLAPMTGGYLTLDCCNFFSSKCN